MNRDEISAIGRAAVTIAAGGAIVLAIARWLGWPVVGLIVAAAVLDYLWCSARLGWRIW